MGTFVLNIKRNAYTFNSDGCVLLKNLDTDQYMIKYNEKIYYIGKDNLETIKLRFNLKTLIEHSDSEMSAYTLSEKSKEKTFTYYEYAYMKRGDDWKFEITKITAPREEEERLCKWNRFVESKTEKLDGYYYYSKKFDKTIVKRMIAGQIESYNDFIERCKKSIERGKKDIAYLESLKPEEIEIRELDYTR